MRWLGSVRSPATLLLLGHAAIGFSLFTNDGQRDLPGLLLLLLGVAAWGKAFAHFVARDVPVAGARRETERVAWGAVLGAALLAPSRTPGYAITFGIDNYYAASVGVAALVGTYALDLRGRPLGPALSRARRVLLFLFAAGLGAWLICASLDPRADVYDVHQQTAQAMLEGRPIYEPGAISVLDTNHHTVVIHTYVYPPLTAYLATLGYALLGHDIRWACLVAQLVAGGLLWLVARDAARSGQSAKGAKPEDAGLAPEIWADLVAALLLFYPRGLLVLEKGWTEPLALPFLGGFVLLALRGRPLAASVCLGLLCACKQHLVLYLPFLVLLPGIGSRGLAVAGVAALATLLPYLLRSPLELYRGVFSAIAGGPFRTDALAIPAELYRVGVEVPSWVGFGAALVPFAWMRRVPRTLPALLVASCLVFALFYTCGRQAFLNYYYLLDATALFAVATLGGPPASSADRADRAAEA